MTKKQTDLLDNWWEDFNREEALNEFTGWPLWMKDYIGNLLKATATRTRQECIGGLEMEFTERMGDAEHCSCLAAAIQKLNSLNN